MSDEALHDRSAASGRLYRAAREAKGIPLEKAAHELRTRVALLKALEEDTLDEDYPEAYAQMFRRIYAKYLGLPKPAPRGSASPACALGGAGTAGWVCLKDTEDFPVFERMAGRWFRPQVAVAVLVCTAVLFLAGLATYGLYAKLGRFDVARLAAGGAPAIERADPLPTASVAGHSKKVSSGTRDDRSFLLEDGMVQSSAFNTGLNEASN